MADTCYELGEGTDTSQDGADRTHTRVFMAVMDSPLSDGVAVLSVSGMPQIMTPHPNDAGALLTRRRPARESGSQTHWRVTLEYATKLGKAPMDITASGGGGGGSGSPSETAAENPFQRPPEFDFDSVRYEEAMIVDMDGNRYENTAGDPFDPPHVEERAYLALTITKNISFFNPQLISTHLYHVNFDPYLGYAQDEVLLDTLRAKVAWEHGQPYWVITARFVFNPIETIREPAPFGGVPGIYRGGWYKRVWNVGFMRKDSSGLLVKLRTPRGEEYTRPQLLNANGTDILASGAEPLMIRFRPKGRKSFSALGLF